MDIGESLVGSYFRYIQGCDLVAYNTHIPGVQGEIDVMGVKLQGQQEVWLCEVITHIEGVLYGSYEDTVTKIREKLMRAQTFAKATFPGAKLHYEIWAPRVPVGKLTKEFEVIALDFKVLEIEVTFVMNYDYTARIQKLVDHARENSSATSEVAYRLLQILTHLRGELRV